VRVKRRRHNQGVAVKRIQVEAARAVAPGVEAAHIHAIIVKSGYFHTKLAAHGH
jgi:hypothetical protein